MSAEEFAQWFKKAAEKFLYETGPAYMTNHGAAWDAPGIPELSDAQLAQLDTLGCPVDLHINPPNIDTTA